MDRMDGMKTDTLHKGLCFMLITLILLIAGCSRSGPGEAGQQTVAPGLPQAQPIDPEFSPDLDKIMANIRAVAAYQRGMGTPGEKDAAAFLQKELESYGYVSQIQPFPFDRQKQFPVHFRDFNDHSFWDVAVTDAQKDGESQNIIAVKKPAQDAGSNIVIISAHYDDTGYGAVLDNATGVALLLETARAIANAGCQTEVRFVLFSGEEGGLTGSRYYVSRLTEADKKNILADINLDYLGVKGSNDLIVATLDGRENQASSLFQTFLQSQELSIVEGPPSDYVSFARAGIPAVSLGQLPMPIKMDGEYTTADEETRKLIQVENLLLDKDRLKTAFHLVMHALNQATN
jgi:aminopeptidase YwaD